MTPRVTICIIGRNEATNLPRLRSSLESVLKRIPETETIFVDSASTDASVAVARACFDQVLVLEQDEGLCAAAGRFVGTLEATGDWILYLDGDMFLRPEFAEALVYLVADSPAERGWVGEYLYMYEDGTVRRNALGTRRGSGPVDHFGGAVLLPRSLVLQAGNWNPGVFSNEEIDLYTRIRAGRGCVEFIDVPMIEHYTERHSSWVMLRESFFPGPVLGRKFYGFGQVVASRLSEGRMLSLVRFFPYPFMLWVGFLALVLSALLGRAPIGGGLFAIAAMAIAMRRGLKYIAICFGLFNQAALGFFRYRAGYVPVIEQRFISAAKV